MKIIQIRGNNGTGKTTIVREYINKNEHDVFKIHVGNRDIDCTKVGEVLIIGRYDKGQCGGCDAAIKTADELKETIAKVSRLIKPSVLVFEGVMYGKTVSFTKDIYLYSKATRAEFLAVCLEPAFETTLERIYGRNGGKDVNVKGLEGGWRSSIKSNAKLRAMKIPTVTYDTGKMSLEEMGEVLENAIKG